MFFLFADDTNLLFSHENLKELIKIINAELGKVSDWIIANKLSLNFSKSKFIIFHPYQRADFIPLLIRIFIQGHAIEHVRELSFLGVTIDENLSWKNHIDITAKKLSRAVGVLKHLKNFVPKNILRLIYNGLILPYINYGILCWGSCNPTTLSRITILQKRAIRIITGARYYSHHEPLCRANKLLNLSDIYKSRICKLIHSWFRNDLPPRIMKLFSKVSDCHDVNTRNANSNKFSIPKFRLSLRSQSPTLSIARIWNILENDLSPHLNLTLNSFAYRCRNYFINRYSQLVLLFM